MTSLEPAAAGKARTKNMVLRLDPDLADLLATVAEVEGRSVSDLAREAIAALVQARRKDKRFRRMLRSRRLRDQHLLDLLQVDRQRPCLTPPPSYGSRPRPSASPPPPRSPGWTSLPRRPRWPR